MAGRPPLRVKDNERETIVAAVNARSAVQTTLSAFAKTAAAAPAGRSVNWQRKLASDELYAIPRTLTAYGTVCQTMAVPGKECDLELYFASPFALLSLAASRSDKLADLLVNMAAATPTGKLEFVFYLDKATPGNQRRLDVGKGEHLAIPSVFHVTVLRGERLDAPLCSQRRRRPIRSEAKRQRHDAEE